MPDTNNNKKLKPLLSLKNINKSFGENQVLFDVSLDIYEGEKVAIIGASGSGKSSLMNILGLMDTDFKGSYMIGDNVISNLSEQDKSKLRRETFGFIFQRYHLISALNVKQNIELPTVYAGIPYNIASQRATELACLVGLSDKLEANPNKLSGGQQQRVSIARALSNNATVVLADEPTGALDSTTGKQIIGLMDELNTNGKTIILITHDPEIAKTAHRIITIKDGVIVSDVKTRNNLYLDTCNATIACTQQAKTSSNSGSILNRFKLINKTYKMALSSIWAHKLRSGLTMLGIIIGITSVVSVIALGSGSQQKILSDISSMGANTIDIYPGKGTGDRNATKVESLKESDLQTLAGLPYIQNVSANLGLSGTLKNDNYVGNASLRGVSSSYFDIKNMQLDSGRLFEPNSQEIVIDQNTFKSVFSSDLTQTIGSVLVFNKVPFKVVGVLAKSKSPFQDDNLTLYSHYTDVATRLQKTKTLNSITVQVKEKDTLNEPISTVLAESHIKDVLFSKHGQQDVYTRNSDSLKQTITSTTQTMTFFVAAIAFIALLVGGIGVMNIMLVSVTERTKEIGIRKAIGATYTNIMDQFLIEAITLCMTGGIAGLLLAVTITQLFNLLTNLSIKMTISPLSVIVSILASSAIGIVFGYIPARTAANLSPVEALSHD